MKSLDVKSFKSFYQLFNHEQINFDCILILITVYLGLFGVHAQDAWDAWDAWY